MFESYATTSRQHGSVEDIKGNLKNILDIDNHKIIEGDLNLNVDTDKQKVVEGDLNFNVDMGIISNTSNVFFGSNFYPFGLENTSYVNLATFLLLKPQIFSLLHDFT